MKVDTSLLLSGFFTLYFMDFLGPGVFALVPLSSVLGVVLLDVTSRIIGCSDSLPAPPGLSSNCCTNWYLHIAEHVTLFNSFSFETTKSLFVFTGKIGICLCLSPPPSTPRLQPIWFQ